MESTYHMINKEALAKMKQGAMLINTSRGPLIDTEALVECLKSGKLRGAALDVYENEEKYFFHDYSQRVRSIFYLRQYCVLIKNDCLII